MARVWCGLEVILVGDVGKEVFVVLFCGFVCGCSLFPDAVPFLDECSEERVGETCNGGARRASTKDEDDDEEDEVELRTVEEREIAEEVVKHSVKAAVATAAKAESEDRYVAGCDLPVVARLTGCTSAVVGRDGGGGRVDLSDRFGERR